MFAQGMVPPSACQAMSSTIVSCTQPVQAVNTVTFQTYSSLKTLYAAYMARVMALAGGQFHTNYGNCTEVLTSGERSWNHNVATPSSTRSTCSRRGGSPTTRRQAGCSVRSTTISFTSCGRRTTVVCSAN